MSDVPGLLTLYNLLARASHVSCSKGANAFLSLLTTEDDRLSLAIDGFIPALQNPDLQIPQRILAAYVLNTLYVSHDFLNPFYDHLLRVFESERANAVAESHVKSFFAGSSQRAPDSLQDNVGMQAGNEQLVWVLWKILQGESDDLAPYSPNTLSRTAIPEHLQPLHLVVPDGSGRGKGTRVNPRRSTPEFPQPSQGFMGPPTFQNSATLFQTGNPSSLSGPSRTPSAPRLASNRMPSTSNFSPFDVASPGFGGLYAHKASGERESQLDGRLQQMVPKESFNRQPRHQHSSDLLGAAYGNTNTPAFSDSIHGKAQADIDSPPQISHDHFPKVIGDQRQKALLRTLFEESYNPESLLGGTVGIYNRPNMNKSDINTEILHESGRVEPQIKSSTLLPSPVSTQSNLQQRPEQNYLRNHNITSENTSFVTSVASDTRSNTRPRLEPISHTHPRSVSSPQSATLGSPASARSYEIFSVDGRVSRPGVAEYGHEFPQATQMRMNNIKHQAPGIPFVQQKRTPTPTRVSFPARSPGVIGSGRPSSVSKNDASVDHRAVLSRWSQIGIIGNERPGSSAADRDESLTSGTGARKEHESMIPFSVLRMRSVKEEFEKREPGITGQPETGLGDVRERKGNGQTSLLEGLKALSVKRSVQEFSQDAGVASFKPKPQASDSNYTPNHDTAESISTHTPPLTFQRQATPLHPSATIFLPKPTGTPVSAAVRDLETATSTQCPYSASPPTSATEHGLNQSLENPQSSPLYTSKKEETSEAHINEKERGELSHAIVLLLSARERVLSLTEQRMLQPHLLTLTQPLSLLRPGDIPQLVAKNSDIAAKLLLFLLDRKDEDAERIERVLRDATKNGLFHLDHGSLDEALSLPAAASIRSMGAVDAIQTVIKFVNTCGTPSSSVGINDVSPFGGREAKEGYLEALRRLPPTMQSFNLIARLLRPTSHGGATSAQQGDSPEVRVATLIRTEVLGGFVIGCVRWIEHAEQEEKDGEVHDDRVAIAISSLCRFYSSLLKHGFVSAASEADTTEIMSFALQFSKFEEARSLYSTLAAVRT